MKKTQGKQERMSTEKNNERSRGRADCSINSVHLTLCINVTYMASRFGLRCSLSELRIEHLLGVCVCVGVSV